MAYLFSMLISRSLEKAFPPPGNSFNAILGGRPILREILQYILNALRTDQSVEQQIGIVINRFFQTIILVLQLKTDPQNAVFEPRDDPPVAREPVRVG